MAAEQQLGNVPVDVSAQKVGYDIQSYDPERESLRFIEVKGRVAGADTVMVTRQEVITSLHEPQKFILAIVEIANGFARRAPVCFPGALDYPRAAFRGRRRSNSKLTACLERAGGPS